jgi:DNA-binding Lrp family transcriptional regulator
LTLAKPLEVEQKNSFYNVKPDVDARLTEDKSVARRSPEVSLTRKSAQLLKMLWENGDRGTVYSFRINQADLAHKLLITRQALSVHLKRLRELGFIQIGRGLINVTDDGLKAIGYNSNPVIVMIRVSPQWRTAAFAKIKTLPAIETFRVAGDVDIVLILGQDELDNVLAALARVEGVVETKSLVSIESLK